MPNLQPALYGLKYKGIKLAHELTPNDLKRIGWNIRRKYARHADTENTKATLLHFAETAIDSSSVDLESFSVVNEALLNAQRWRYDPENFSVDPPLRPEWAELWDLLEAASSHPSVPIAYIKDQVHNFQPGDASELRFNFFFLILNRFFCRRLKLSDESEATRVISAPRLSDALKSVLKDKLVLSNLIGLDDEIICQKLSIDDFWRKANYQVTYDSASETDALRVTMAKLTTEKLFVLEETLIGKKITINENHAWIRSLSKEALQTITPCLIALADAQAHMGRDQTAVSRFISYWSRSLSDRFS